MANFNATLIMVDTTDLVTLDEAIDALYDMVVRTGDDTLDDIAYELKGFRSRIETALGA